MGYDMVFYLAIVTVAGGLGVIIPPSISYIVYSARLKRLHRLPCLLPVFFRDV